MLKVVLMIVKLLLMMKVMTHEQRLHEILKVVMMIVTLLLMMTVMSSDCMRYLRW